MGIQVEEFNVLNAIHNEKSLDMKGICKRTAYEEEKAAGLLSALREKGWVADQITESGYQALEEYR